MRQLKFSYCFTVFDEVSVDYLKILTNSIVLSLKSSGTLLAICNREEVKN